jgi:hypothetical protein
MVLKDYPYLNSGAYPPGKAIGVRSLAVLDGNKASRESPPWLRGSTSRPTSPARAPVTTAMFISGQSLPHRSITVEAVDAASVQRLIRGCFPHLLH